MSEALDDPFDVTKMKPDQIVRRLREVPEVEAWIKEYGESFHSDAPGDSRRTVGEMLTLLGTRLWRLAIYSLKGGSEGHYVHVDVLGASESTLLGGYVRTCLPLICCKTFAGALEAERFCLILKRALGDEYGTSDKQTARQIQTALRAAAYEVERCVGDNERLQSADRAIDHAIELLARLYGEVGIRKEGPCAKCGGKLDGQPSSGWWECDDCKKKE